MFEFDDNQDTLDLGSDLSEALECASTESTRYDPNFGHPVRKNFSAQTGFDNRFLASDPRSVNATRFLRRGRLQSAS